MERTAGLACGGGGSSALDAFTDPVVLPIDGALCVANMQVVARALSQAVGMSSSGTCQFILGASELIGSLFHGSPRGGRILLRLLRNRKSVGIEMVLECEGDGAGPETTFDAVLPLLDEYEVVPTDGGGRRVVARKWECSKL